MPPQERRKAEERPLERQEQRISRVQTEGSTSREGCASNISEIQKLLEGSELMGRWRQLKCLTGHGYETISSER